MTNRLRPPASGEDWVALTTGELPAHTALSWPIRPDCGAVVTFSGTVRDHAEGRPGVTALEYEAYEEQVEPRLARIARDLRRRWPEAGRVVLLHRVGALAVGDCSVLVAVSAPHRGTAFDAARWAIDTLKATVPIWKLERWQGGEDWGTDAQTVDEPAPRRANMAGDPTTAGTPSAKG